MEEQKKEKDSLPLALATWIFMLCQSGDEPGDPAVAAACRELQEAGGDAPVEELGEVLQGAIAEALGTEDPTLEQVWKLLASWYGEARLGTDLGTEKDREARARTIRKYQFGRSFPWLARIVDRFQDGRVGLHWVMVEEVTDRVRLMDPYPWDDVDEEYELPLGDFMVKWELAGRESLRIL